MAEQSDWSARDRRLRSLAIKTLLGLVLVLSVMLLAALSHKGYFEERRTNSFRNAFLEQMPNYDTSISHQHHKDHNMGRKYQVPFGHRGQEL